MVLDLFAFDAWPATYVVSQCALGLFDEKQYGSKDKLARQLNVEKVLLQEDRKF